MSYCNPLPIQETFGEQGRNYPGVCVGGGGGTPQSLSDRVYPYNIVGQSVKIFECLRLKSDSARRNCTNYGKLFRVKNAMSGNIPPPPAYQHFWENKY